jgi:preprotein translocase subunit SecA
MLSFLSRCFGNRNAREIRVLEKTVVRINSFEPAISTLSNEDLANKTVEFRAALTNGKTLDDILPEAFSVVREASKRVLGMRHFDVQLIGGIVLHNGQIAEMKTGEGKTLVATLAVYLNALPGKGVHVVTVNDYLARRDAEWMGQIYRSLGMSVATITSGMQDHAKRQAYLSDVTYGTNSEFGFDYLRDNLKFSEQEMVMRPFNFAVVDEVDSILIDEARTPLIISGASDDSSHLYITVDSVIRDIIDEDFEKDEKLRTVALTDSGVEKVEKRLADIGLLSTTGLYDLANISIVYHVNCALKAHKLFSRDVDYIVRDDQVLIIDEFTGRVMDGRRYSEGLHQALEAKEMVKVQAESQTVATISYQNLFRLYPKLSGMTGTAMTEEAEFEEIYKLKVFSIPPHKPAIREDKEDSIFLTLEEKDRATMNLIEACHKKLQPVLVGTTSLERSEDISRRLARRGIKHNVLNAKQHEREACIVAEAGALGAVTIATNMAGRGTDIKLGGGAEMRIAQECESITDPDERDRRAQEIRRDVEDNYRRVAAIGGLFVIGTERNDSRRIDNQLRGRSGRQGDPGASKYFLSLEDDLIRKFGSPNFAKTLQRMGIQKDEDLTHRWISKAIEKAQQRVEAYNFDIRKQLLRYDDVMNDQRKIVYSQRMALIRSDDISENIRNMISNVLDDLVTRCAPQETLPSEWNLAELSEFCKETFGIGFNVDEVTSNPSMNPDILHQRLEELVFASYNEKLESNGEFIRRRQKEIAISELDNGWRNHLTMAEHLRRGISLRAYAQKNPLNEYKFEAFNMFEEMLRKVGKEVVKAVFSLPSEQEEPQTLPDSWLNDILARLAEGDKHASVNDEISMEAPWPNDILPLDGDGSRDMRESSVAGGVFGEIAREDTTRFEDNISSSATEETGDHKPAGEYDQRGMPSLDEDRARGMRESSVAEDGISDEATREDAIIQFGNDVPSHAVGETDKREPANDAAGKKLDADVEGGHVASVRRNALCPCGKGKRYKHCCGSLKKLDFMIKSNATEEEPSVEQSESNSSE